MKLTSGQIEALREISREETPDGTVWMHQGQPSTRSWNTLHAFWGGNLDPEENEHRYINEQGQVFRTAEASDAGDTSQLDFEVIDGAVER